MSLPPEHDTQRPWVNLDNIDDAEIWIANSNLELNFYLEQGAGAGRASALPNGQGICLELELGGEIYVHTTSEGIVILDVTEPGKWVEPLLSACTNGSAPKGQIWVLPENSLVQLLLGLNSLIKSYRIVLQHRYGVAT